ADEISKYNYKEFCDVVSFVATFKTNNIVVTDQDGAMRNAIQAEFAGLKDRLCMWHITLKLHAKFWSTAKVKTINEETQIHALVDGNKIVITESYVRRDLQFADED
ncbi:protein FAR1-related sequence 5, partial [Tanacetum coccineum]